MRSALGWLLPRTPVGQLPVPPKYSQGEPSQLAFVRVEPDAPGSRLVLRLWRSHFKVRDVNGKQPLWYGALYREKLYRTAHLLTIADTRNVAASEVINVLPGLRKAAVMRSVSGDETLRYAVLVPPGATRQQPLSERQIWIVTKANVMTFVPRDLGCACGNVAQIQSSISLESTEEQEDLEGI
jgi:hypothetical protein